MSALDWTEFFESVSLVDQVLHAGPDYAAMDFATRDAYRHAVEELGRGSGRPELDVARLAVARAQPSDETHDARQSDPGFYLIGNGRPAFELTLGYRAPPLRRLLRLYVAAATPGYLGTIALLSGFMLAVPVLAGASGVGSVGLLVLALLAIVPASDLAIALLNRSVTALVRPAALPRLALRDGVPPHLRTMVVVPMLLTDSAEVTEHSSGSKCTTWRIRAAIFALPSLSDWLDAPAESIPGDDETLGAAREDRPPEPPPRCRAGWGSDSCSFTAGGSGTRASGRGWGGSASGQAPRAESPPARASDTSFVGTGSVTPSGVRYVITLDADTRLPEGWSIGWSGRWRIPSIAHGSISEGNASSRLRGASTLATPPLPGREGSFFQRLRRGRRASTRTHRRVSDVYQDLWEEGSYTGKGIYDLDAFEPALAGRVPDNALLSQ